MRVAVTVVPCLFMSVIATRRNQLVQNRRQVLLQSRLKFNRPYGGGTANIEDIDDTRFDVRMRDCCGDILGQIVHVSLAGGGDSELMLRNHRRHRAGYKGKERSQTSVCLSSLSLSLHFSIFLRENGLVPHDACALGGNSSQDTWKENPNGAFVNWHPEVSCESFAGDTTK